MHRLTSNDSSFAVASVGFTSVGVSGFTSVGVSGFTSVGVLGFTSVGVLGFTSVGAHVDSSCSCGGDKILTATVVTQRVNQRHPDTHSHDTHL